MIEDVLKEIREAEQRAEQLQKEAYQRGKELVLNAEAEAERQRKDTVRECKEDRKAALQRARVTSGDKAQAAFKKSVEQVANMTEDKSPEIEKAASKVVELLIEKYIVADEDAE